LTAYFGRVNGPFFLAKRHEFGASNTKGVNRVAELLERIAQHIPSVFT
jgi:hypothetical protein